MKILVINKYQAFIKYWNILLKNWNAGFISKEQ